jgi:hypothetical protein
LRAAVPFFIFISILKLLAGWILAEFDGGAGREDLERERDR